MSFPSQKSTRSYLHPGDDVELPYEVTPSAEEEAALGWEEPAIEDEMDFERRRNEVLRQAAERAEAESEQPQPDFVEVMERHRRLRAEAEAWQAAARANPAWAAQEMERLRQERLREIEAYFATRGGNQPASAAQSQAGETPGAQGNGLAAPASLAGSAAPKAEETPAARAGALEEPAEPRGEEEALPAPIFLRLAATPPPLRRALQRPAPLLGKVAPLPAEEGQGVPPVSQPAGAGLWASRWASLTTADDPLYVLLVGLNALLELRLRWRVARPSPAILNALVRPLEPETLASWPTERLLARLGVEAEQLMQVLEAPLVGFLDWAEEALEELRAQMIARRQDQLKELIAVLRKRLQKRRTVRRVGELITRLAWEAYPS